MKIEILCTGDEILSGKTVNTNYSHIARRLIENGFNPIWGTVVGDDPESLVRSFHLAGQRADAVIVNGGLGPTIDDLSQQVAAQAAGVELELAREWLDRIEAWYISRGRKMPSSNIKQAMLPVGSELIDNPVGTACGFAMDIGRARFFFTPGVPVELKRMLEEQILPRLHMMRGEQVFIRIKRFHTFGIGEARADRILDGVETLVNDGSVKLGFQSHYPQLEIKLTLHGTSQAELDQKIAPVENEVRRRLGNFILCEDDQSVEKEIVRALQQIGGSISIMEMHTGGRVTARLVGTADSAESIISGIVSVDVEQLLKYARIPVPSIRVPTEQMAICLADAIQARSNSSHALVVLMKPLEKQEGSKYAADFIVAISGGKASACRISRLPGSPEWVRLGAVELALDCLRRYLLGLPVQERIDFELH